MTEPTPSAKPLSFLDLVAVVDNFRVGPLPPHAKSFKTEELVPWALSPDPSAPIIGLLRAPIVQQLIAENSSIPDAEKDKRPWYIDPLSSEDSSLGRRRISFAGWVNTPSKRTNVMRSLCERWRDTGLWSDIVGPKKWRGEDYPVYRNPIGSNDAPLKEEDSGEDERDTRNYAFRMERAACALFGVVTYGVHMTVYVDSPDDKGEKSIWVPKRAKTKQTWPGYLDNSVAGGIPAGLKPFEALVKEAMEEASIEEDIVRRLAKCTGSISYFFCTKDGWLQPEVEYLYEMRVPAELAEDPRYQPKPHDGEVESFELLPLSEVENKMRAGLFKPNCAGALLDFLIRHGLLTPDNEPDFLEIQTRLRGRFDYERW
ncbi:NUDIX hydrolase domain-like protein [Irpex rosettiformis]|uniref:NUDIX hydrolase domain-like protein n=1 Tax=Irpex rosettiformis TaxID=378272 RepID=A0ACB8U500_9APHY|nr:NUDIX hydrolase domain-like protein [Irpex rosettiformis]